MHFKTLKELDRTEGTVQLLSDSQAQKHLGGTNIVLIPQPSNHPDDPLRWSKSKKHTAFASVCFFTFFNNFSGTVLSDSFFTLAADFNVSLNTVSGLLTWVVLTLGLANFFWVPTANYVGKRPVFVIACGITFVAAIWAAASKSFGSLRAACIVGGFGGGASEALGAAIINDLYFLHERGAMMGVYVIFLCWGSSFGPLIGGYLIQDVGWQWSKWLSAICLGLNLLMIIFFLPETRFDRKELVSEMEETKSQEDVAITASAEKESEVKAVDANSTESLGKAEIKAVDGNSTESLGKTAKNVPTASKTYIQGLSMWSGLYTHGSYLELFLRPIPLMAYPACIFAALTYSIALAPTVMINIVSSIILVPPPYNFHVGSVGLLNIPGLIGQFVGAIGGGYLTDLFARYMSRKRQGTFHPETRLMLIAFPALMVFAGILLFGFAAQKQLHWAALFVAYGMVSVGLSGASGIAMTYVLDSYFPIAAECLEMINGLKNVIAFGFAKGTIIWVKGWGYAKTFGALAGIFGLFVGLAVPLIIWGPKIRHYTSNNWRLITWQLE